MANGVNHSIGNGYINSNVFGRNTTNWGGFGGYGTPAPQVAQGQPFTVNNNFTPQGGAGYVANDFSMNYRDALAPSKQKIDNSFSIGEWGELGVGTANAIRGFKQLSENKQNAGIKNQYLALDAYNQGTQKNNVLREREQFRQQALGNQLGSDANILATNAYMGENKLRTGISEA